MGVVKKFLLLYMRELWKWGCKKGIKGREGNGIALMSLVALTRGGSYSSGTARILQSLRGTRRTPPRQHNTGGLLRNGEGSGACVIFGVSWCAVFSD